jgi:hypothetical protein
MNHRRTTKRGCFQKPGRLLVRRMAEAFLFCALLHSRARAEILSGGVDPTHLGKGDWIYVLSQAEAKLGGNVQSVHDLASLLAFEKSQGMNFLVVKAGEGAKIFPAANAPQFTLRLVDNVHAAGMYIFGYTRSYGKNIPGELSIITNALRMGADGYVIDAEEEWESKSLPNNRAAAVRLLAPIKAAYPNKFLAHSPFPYIHYHKTFPYLEFGLYCDAVMPQAYWRNFGLTAAKCVADMDEDWRTWQDGLTGPDRNAIKPLVPIAQGFSPSIFNTVTATQITQFSEALKNDHTPATQGGYHGILFFRAELHSANMWAGIGGITFSPSISIQPTNTFVVAGQDSALRVVATGSPPPTYQWRFNATNLNGATNNIYYLPQARSAQAGYYSVAISNRVGFAASSIARLGVVEPVDILIQPLSQSVPQGGSATFSVGASGSPPFDYQWRFGGTNLQGAVSNHYTVTNARIADIGAYSVIISNDGGTKTSASAFLSELPVVKEIQPAPFEPQTQMHLHEPGDTNSAIIFRSGGAGFDLSTNQPAAPMPTATNHPPP